MPSSNGQFWYGYQGFLYKKNGGGGARRVFPYGLLCNKPTDLNNRYIPGSGVGGTSIAVRRTKLIKATSCNNNYQCHRLMSQQTIIPIDPVVDTKTAPKSAPTFTVTPGYNSVLLTSVSTANDGGSPITNYEYSSDNGVTFIPFNPPQTSGQFIIPSLNIGTPYSIQLKAMNIFGNGPQSLSQTVTPLNPTVYFPLTSDLINSVSSSSITMKSSNTAEFGTPSKSDQLGFNFTNNNYLISSQLDKDSLELPLSICFYCYIPPPPTTTTQYPFSIGNTSGSFSLYSFIGYDSEELYISSYIGITSFSPKAVNITNSLNQWTHICYSFSESNISFYVNGIPSYNNPSPSDFSLYYSDLSYLFGISPEINDVSPESNDYFNGGYISQFLCYNQALTQDQVISIMNST